MWKVLCEWCDNKDFTRDDVVVGRVPLNNVNGPARPPTIVRSGGPNEVDELAERLRDMPLGDQAPGVQDGQRAGLGGIGAAANVFDDQVGAEEQHQPDIQPQQAQIFYDVPRDVALQEFLRVVREKSKRGASSMRR